jgi:hypothetical protein
MLSYNAKGEIEHKNDDDGDKKQTNDDMDYYYYALDDDALRNPLIAYNDDTVQDEKRCRRTSWHRDLHITCNSLHEMDAVRGFGDGRASFLGSGDYREAFLVETAENDEPPVIFKAFRWGSKFAYPDYEYMRIDALGAEIFTSSPWTVNICASC